MVIQDLLGNVRRIVQTEQPVEVADVRNRTVLPNEEELGVAHRLAISSTESRQLEQPLPHLPLRRVHPIDLLVGDAAGIEEEQRTALIRRLDAIDDALRYQGQNRPLLVGLDLDAAVRVIGVAVVSALSRVDVSVILHLLLGIALLLLLGLIPAAANYFRRRRRIRSRGHRQSSITSIPTEYRLLLVLNTITFPTLPGDH
mmetsp:Transcript_22054/g.52196  ORF Transcript_22054/g.52196 Transcript_22054/m.52196 type:complete len:200 (+) Transcript_22054:190-789(+)